MDESETGRSRTHRDQLSALGTAALRGRDLDTLLGKAVVVVAEGMGTKFAKVLEYLPNENKLLVRAGVGWRPGVVGHARLGADDLSPAGHALRTLQPVISNDVDADGRFRTPELLLEHGVRRAINAIIQGDGVPYGVLEVDSGVPGAFLESDVSFLQAAANLLGLAVERSRRESELKQALDARDLLLREADHRIKNSLQLVASMLSMQRSRLTDPELRAALDGGISRVRAIAEAHRALFQSSDLSNVAFGAMLSDICAHVGELSPLVVIQCQSEEGLNLDAERAIPLGLVVNELLTNAVRHAYPAETGGPVTASANRDGDDLVIEIADRGTGFDDARPPGRSLGGSIVTALSRQIGLVAETVSRPGHGAVVTLRLPLDAGPGRNGASGS